MPTELPSCRAALAKFLSYRVHLSYAELFRAIMRRTSLSRLIIRLAPPGVSRRCGDGRWEHTSQTC